MTRWSHMTEEQAKKLGLHGFWQLHQMEMKESKSLNDKVKEQEEEDEKE